MEEHKTRSEGSKARSMEDLLEQREKLDRLLHDEFRKEVTLLFTDICGYTQYIDTKGDIGGNRGGKTRKNRKPSLSS